MDVVTTSKAAKHERSLVRNRIAANWTFVIGTDLSSRHDRFTVRSLDPGRFALRRKMSSKKLVNFGLKKCMLPDKRIVLGQPKHLQQHEQNVNAKQLTVLVLAVAAVRVTDSNLELSLRRRALQHKAHWAGLLHDKESAVQGERNSLCHFNRASIPPRHRPGHKKI